VHEHRGEQRQPGGGLVGSRLVALVHERLLLAAGDRRGRVVRILGPAELARVGDLVRDLGVLDRVGGVDGEAAAVPPCLLEAEEHHDVDHDEDDRDDREAVRRDVVLQRQHAGRAG
jgi:hypothetical protein